jgi:hypothetical protein
VTKPDKTSRELGAMKRTLRSNVLNELAGMFPDDYHRLMAEAFAEEGLTYERPMSDVEIARETVRGLIARYPELADQVAAVLPFGESETFGDEPEDVTVVVQPGIDDDIMRSVRG